MWKGLNFGIAYNRTNNFNSNITIQGNSNNSTFLDQVVNDANRNTTQNANPQPQNEKTPTTKKISPTATGHGQPSKIKGTTRQEQPAEFQPGNNQD